MRGWLANYAGRMKQSKEEYKRQLEHVRTKFVPMFFVVSG